MPMKIRDGKVIEEATESLKPEGAKPAGQSGLGGAYDEPTMRLTPGQTPAPQVPAGQPASPGGAGGGQPIDGPIEEKTELVGGLKRAGKLAAAETSLGVGGGQGSAADPQTDPQTDPMTDPVVGWLVVVAGPGKGAFRPIGYGQNSIGRSPSQRICLDFGDTTVAREVHAMLTYEHKSRRFFIAPGTSANLTYVDGDEPVLAPREVASGAEISVGETMVRLVAFCGPGFDWQDSGA
ncbi:MAG: FHA domain-containing protein [Pseudomonadota bacterium]